MNTRELISSLVGERYPVGQAVGADDGRFVRRWVVRFREEVSSEIDLTSLGENLVIESGKVLTEAFGSKCSDQELRESMPAVSIVRIGRCHCAVIIESPTSGRGVGDAAAIGTWTTLRSLDRALTIDDIEGIPKRFWFFMK